MNVKIWDPVYGVSLWCFFGLSMKIGVGITWNNIHKVGIDIYIYINIKNKCVYIYIYIYIYRFPVATSSFPIANWGLGDG